MIHVAQAARLLGSEPRFGALEPPPTATALSRTSLLAGKGGKAFGGVLADSTLLATMNNVRATAPFVADRHLIFGAGTDTQLFGDPNAYDNGVGQAGVRILSWREVR